MGNHHLSRCFNHLGVAPMSIKALPDWQPEKILYTWQPKKSEKANLYEDVADAYVVVEEPQALSGFIVYGLYGERWVANPFNMRPLIRKMLQDLGRWKNEI
jgi:hypothetical protein